MIVGGQTKACASWIAIHAFAQAKSVQIMASYTSNLTWEGIPTDIKCMSFNNLAQKLKPEEAP